MEEIVRDSRYFIDCLFLGFFSRGLYDLLLLKRRILKSGKIVSSIGDVLFFSVFACVLFEFILEHYYGEVRIFAYIGVALSWSFYQIIIRDTIVTLLNSVFNFLFVNIIQKSVKMIVEIVKNTRLYKIYVKLSLKIHHSCSIIRTRSSQEDQLS